jgi:hypothetical protein
MVTRAQRRFIKIVRDPQVRFAKTTSLGHLCFEALSVQCKSRVDGVLLVAVLTNANSPVLQRSLERSALLEAVEQLTRALDLITTLPATAVLRREEIKLRVTL